MSLRRAEPACYPDDNRRLRRGRDVWRKRALTAQQALRDRTRRDYYVWHATRKRRPGKAAAAA